MIATSFELEAGDGTRLSTETRVQPTDGAAARAFRPYWWAIRGGSGLICRDVTPRLTPFVPMPRIRKPNQARHETSSADPGR
jgi:hypothetical protein